MDDLFKCKELKRYKNDKNISKAQFGVSASVWIIPDNVVIKQFPMNYSKERIDFELAVIGSLGSMKVSKCIERFICNDKETVVYKYIAGDVFLTPSIEQIKAVANFMRQMHDKLKDFAFVELPRLYDIDLFKKNVLLNANIFAKDIKTIDFIQSDTTVIHGDLFPDNALFDKDKLKAVIDFSNASIGDIYFDIAVTLFSWCGDDIYKINIFLEAYGIDIDRYKLKNAINYALLYYIVQRYKTGRDWQSLYLLRRRVLNMDI